MGSMSLIKRLIRDVGWRHWPSYAGAFACMALVAGATALSAWLMKDIVNQIFIGQKLDFLFILSGSVVAIFLVKGLSTYGQQVILSRVANSVVADVQRRIFDHMLQWSVRQYTERHSSDFMARQAFITRSAGSLLNLLITAFARDALTVVGLLTVMIIQDPVVSLVALIFMPFAVFGVSKLSDRVRKVVQEEFAGFSKILETLQETSQGIRVVKAFTMEASMRRRQGEAIRSIRKASNKLALVGARSSPLMETIGGLAIGAVILYGGWRVIVAGHTPGEFFSFITALLLAYEPAKRLARMNIDLSASLVGVRMLYEFLDTPADEEEDEHKPDLMVSSGDIELRGVTFGYRTDEPLFRQFAFMGTGGKTTALVGRSGAGKSTLFSLLLRYYEPQAGSILIDGQDIRGVSRQSLRRAIAYVGQDAFLFKGTIRDNIAVGDESASFDSIVSAAKAASADGFIRDFQDGYDTPCGENGAQLSGGQRQRIAIARAFLKNAPILLLDEATSALDSASEKAVQEAIDRLRRGRTTLVIAHRLSTVMDADAICVLENGVLMEEGRHAELISTSGAYAAMCALQFRSAARAALADESEVLAP